MAERPVRLDVLAVVVGIAVGAILFGATLTTTTRVECGSTSSGPTPLGSPPLSLNRPIEGRAGASFYYNFSVGSAGGGLAINNLNFQVKTSGGATVPIAGAGPITVVSITTSASLATYSYANAVWTTGNPTLALNSTMSINIVTTASLSGDALVTIGIGSFSGQVSTAIP